MRTDSLHLFLVLLCVSALNLLGCSSKSQRQVVVVEKTKSYHTTNCPRVYMANVRYMTRDEAIATNYKPCPGCKPDSER